MGGDMQPQGHVHTVLGIVDHRLNPQSVFDAPRVRVAPNGTVHVESTLHPDVIRQLAALGHDVRVEVDWSMFGGGQMIWRDPDTGVYICGTEPRKDGVVAAW